MKIRFEVLLLFLSYISRKKQLIITQSQRRNFIICIDCEFVNECCTYNTQTGYVELITDTWETYLVNFIANPAKFPDFCKCYFNDKNPIAIKAYSTGA